MTNRAILQKILRNNNDPQQSTNLGLGARGGEGESLTRSARNRRRRFGHNATATRSDRHAAFPRAKACTSAVVRALPPIPPLRQPRRLAKMAKTYRRIMDQV